MKSQLPGSLAMEGREESPTLFHMDLELRELRRECKNA